MPDWLNEDWKYRRELTIHSSRIPIADDLVDFPFPVRGTDPTFAAHAQKNGDDFVFTLSDGVTRVPHQVRYWNPKSGRLVCDVLIPLLTAGADILLYLYYGNPTCPDQSDAPRVWSGFAYQQHFLLDPHAPDGGATKVVRAASGQKTAGAFFETPMLVLESLLTKDWLLDDTPRKKLHPAITRYKLCRELAESDGSFRAASFEDLTELASLLHDSVSLIRCTGGEVGSFRLGELANYGDAGVQARILREVRSPTKFLDVLSELQWAAWHEGAGHRVTAFETSGVDHMIEIPGWKLPILSDCKRIAAARTARRVRRVIEKANRQIKEHSTPAIGVVVIDLSDRCPTFDLGSLTDSFPDELGEYRAAAQASIREWYTSVSAVVLVWNEISILRDAEADEFLLVTLRARSELLTHHCPVYPLELDAQKGALGYAGQVEFVIRLRR